MRHVGVMAVAVAVLAGGLLAAEAAKGRFEREIDAFVHQDEKHPPKPGQVLFVGSSSIRKWDIGKSFPKLDAINRGFGGSTMPEVLGYFDRVVKPYAPRAIVLYCGDNDISGGRTAQQVAEDFKAFVGRVRAEVGEATEVVYIMVKPSRARWKLWPAMKDANDRIAAWSAGQAHVSVADIAAPMLATAEKAGAAPAAELFLADGLHLSDAGYAMWAKVIGPMVGAEAGDSVGASR